MIVFFGFANERLDDCRRRMQLVLFRLEVLIERGGAAVSCDANRTKTVCRAVEHMNFFLKVNNLEL